MLVWLRGLAWMASLIGAGALFGGDDIETQTVIKETTMGEKIFWILLCVAVLGGLGFIVWLFFFRNKKKAKGGN